MLRTSRVSILLALAGLCACSTSATAPGSNGSGGGGGGGGGSSTTTTYVGAIASPVALGSFTAAITTTAGSSALASDRAVETRQASSPVRIRSGASASITITLVSGATLTLTGSVSGTLFTVSDGNGDSCSGNVAKILTANCTIAGFPVTITGVVVVGSALAGFTTYCGLESPVGASYGAGALLLDIAGSNAFVGRIAAVNDSGSLYIGPVSSSSFTTNAGFGAGSTNTFTGAFTSTSASGTESNSGGTVIENWTATPCTLLEATATPSTVRFATPANQTVTVTPAGGTGMLGPIAAVVTPASATWLTTTVSGNVVTLSATQPTAGSPTDATVEIYAMFAAAPLAVTVTYTGNSAQPALWLGASNGALYEFQNPSTSFPGTPTDVTSQVVGLEFLAADRRGDLWMSSPSASALYEKQAAHLTSTGYDVSITIATAGPQNQIQPNGIAFDASQTLWVVDANNSGWFYGYTASALAASPPSSDPTYKLQLGGVLNGGTITSAQLTAVAFDASGNMWIADAATSVVYELLAGQISGSGVDVQTYGIMQVGPNANAQPHSIAFDASGNLWVSFLGSGVPYSLYVYSSTALGNIQHNSTPSPYAVVDVSGGLNPVTSIAFDGIGNLWLVQSNGGSGTVGMVAKSELPTSAGGPYGVAATTFGPPSGNVPTAIAFAPPPSGVTIYSAVGGRHAPAESPLAAVRGGLRRP